VAGQRASGRRPTARPQGAQSNTEKAEQETDIPASQRRSQTAQTAHATNGPTNQASASALPRTTRLIPQVRITEDPRPAAQPRATAAPRNFGPPRLQPISGEAITLPPQATGVLKSASAPPEAPSAPTKVTKASGETRAVKTPRMTGAPAGSSATGVRKTMPPPKIVPETVVLPALDETSDNHDDHGDNEDGQARRRRRTTARPVRPEDTALVARQTLILNALEVVSEDARIATSEVPAVRPSHEMDVVDADIEPRTPVTVVPAGALAPTPEWMEPRYREPRSIIAGVATCLITIALVLGALQAASPLSVAQSGIAPFGLLGVQNASDSAFGDPSGPWDTQAGVYLGLGGGAGPGVKAPGSAGLPVGKGGGGSTPNTTPTTKPVISPPPLRPWPPSWAYVAVPGYHAFRVSRPSNNYYWWAFGQCTWWAQYKRQDENLRRMGNARYWAAGAAARGYRVGRTPVRGATVVFQPGVEGAGGAGHVAHVEKVYPGGWFLVSEMNFYWNGGGWGRVDYRFAYVRSGVSFIY
jgi:surface antigen